MPLKGLTPGISLSSFPSPIPPKSGGSNMKSYQSGSFTGWNDTTTTKDIPISEVSTATSGTVAIVRVSVSADATGAPNAFLAGATLLNSTTLRLTRNTGTAATTNNYFWEVFEFNNVKSKQIGVTALAVNPANVSISSVNTQKSIPFLSYTTNSASPGDPTLWTINYRIQDSTTLLVSGRNNTITAYWQVVEFN